MTVSTTRNTAEGFLRMAPELRIGGVHGDGPLDWPAKFSTDDETVIATVLPACL